ncbi:hypothetical protein FOBRF1_007579 [Fusarium oxysporum]
MSGLEPLAALGFVCNIVQSVEVGLKTATLCKNAYCTGEPDPELSIYAPEPRRHRFNFDSFTGARNCRDAEAEWRKKTPAQFLSQQQPRKRDRIGEVFRGTVNKPELDRLESQLQKAKASLETDLLIGVFKRLDISKVQTDNLQDELQTLLQASSQAKRDSMTLFKHRLISHANQGKDTLLAEAEVRGNSRRDNEAYERLQRSFYYPDMSHRRNEIHSSHASTFHWIFEREHEDEYLESEASQSDSDAQELVCSSFVPRLKSIDDRYWISGRPGTGKSVLMNFIISDERTVDSLQQWQPNAQILTYFFWKVGSPMQSSFKGFLCSLVYQLLSLDKEHAIGCLQKDPNWSRKTVPGDWDSEDLQYLLSSYLSQAARPFCLFIDGLDELMEDSGKGILINLLNSLQISSRLVKVCMSSRPEQAIRTRQSREPDLKMQDLTRVDIERYVRDTFETKFFG